MGLPAKDLLKQVTENTDFRFSHGILYSGEKLSGIYSFIHGENLHRHFGVANGAW